MVKLLIGITGSVASIKLAQLITELHKQFGQVNLLFLFNERLFDIARNHAKFA